MPKTKHTATAPDGSTFKRISENRLYSHMVTGRNDEAAAFRTADEIHDSDRRNFDYYAELASGAHDHVQPTAWRDQAKCAEEIAKAAAMITGLNRDTYAAQQREKRLADHTARITAGHFTTWRDLGWASRLDLAQKAAAQAAKHYVDVQILEAIR